MYKSRMALAVGMALSILSGGALADGTDKYAGQTVRIYGMEFVWIPAGSFVMGSPASELGRNPETERQRTVEIARGFFMGKYEITQSQWMSVMGTLPSCNRPGENLPVHNVSWNECQTFLERLSAKWGVQYRLPSEAEWEYACRAGTTTAFSFGERTNTLSAYCMPETGEKRPSPIPVGRLLANPWGLHDIHGNVAEWCQDTTPYRATTPEMRTLAYFRGGSWLRPPEESRSAARAAYYVDDPFCSAGLRICFDVRTEMKSDPSTGASTRIEPRKTAPPTKSQETRSKPSSPPNAQESPAPKEPLKPTPRDEADLRAAAYRGDIVECRMLLAQGVSPNAGDERGLTALHYGAMRGQAEAIALLLEGGADPRIEDAEGLTAAAWAIAAGQSELADILHRR